MHDYLCKFRKVGSRLQGENEYARIYTITLDYIWRHYIQFWIRYAEHIDGIRQVKHIFSYVRR